MSELPNIGSTVDLARTAKASGAAATSVPARKVFQTQTASKVAAMLSRTALPPAHGGAGSTGSLGASRMVRDAAVVELIRVLPPFS